MFVVIIRQSVFVMNLIYILPSRHVRLLNLIRRTRECVLPARGSMRATDDSPRGCDYVDVRHGLGLGLNLFSLSENKVRLG